MGFIRISLVSVIPSFCITIRARSLRRLPVSESTRYSTIVSIWGEISPAFSLVSPVARRRGYFRYPAGRFVKL